jgi:metal-dependent amidase/aminoacylase/carboxypeptidase family protein
MHACGHDMHVTWLIGAATMFSKSREAWKGTLMAVFQPAEETAQGSQAMIDDGLFKRFPKPDVILGQHVTAMPAGVIGGASALLPQPRTACKSNYLGAALTAPCPRRAWILW